jgi:uncharacterized protein
MEILIEQIPEDGLVLEFEKSVNSFQVLTEMMANGECEFKVPIRTALRALRIGEIVEIEGDVASTVWLPCSRCLKPFETSLNSHFSLTYMRPPAESEWDDDSREIELNAEDLGMVYFQGDKINLIDTIQEQVLMEFPFRVLCKPDCKGLCPSCGADLNENSCDCNPKPETGKFDVLKNLKIDN